MSPLTPKRILIVEDDTDLVACVCALLDEEGYSAIIAANGVQALAACEQDPDLVLLDLHLPGEPSGADLVFALRQRLDPSVRVLLLSGEHDVLACAEAVGADGALAKPFDLDALVDAIHTYC